VLVRSDSAGATHAFAKAPGAVGRNGYETTVLPSGCPVGTPEEALDCACGLYLNDLTAWTPTPDELTGETASDQGSLARDRAIPALMDISSYP
jgi:hypothetical protein